MMNRRPLTPLACAAFTIAVLASASFLHAETLMVDLDAAGGPNQTGYLSWNPSHTDGGALNQSTTFAASFATDGNVDVTMTTLNNTYERNYSAVTGTFASLSNLLRDIVFFNRSRSSPGPHRAPYANGTTLILTEIEATSTVSCPSPQEFPDFLVIGQETPRC